MCEVDNEIERGLMTKVLYKWQNHKEQVEEVAEGVEWVEQSITFNQGGC